MIMIKQNVYNKSNKTYPRQTVLSWLERQKVGGPKNNTRTEKSVLMWGTKNININAKEKHKYKYFYVKKSENVCNFKTKHL